MTSISRPIASYMHIIMALIALVTCWSTEHITSNDTMETTIINRSGVEFNQSYYDFESLKSELYNETYDNVYAPVSNESYYSIDGVVVNDAKIKPICTPLEQCAGKCSERTVDYFNQCQCDDLCWFYGDCCFDYYASCLNVTIFDDDETILRSLITHVDSYFQLPSLFEAYRWRRLSTCVQLRNRTFHAVSACGTDPDLQASFDKLHENLIQYSLNHTKFFHGMAQADIIERCQQQNWSHNPSEYRLERIPASFNTNYSTIYFYNVFCAICNGIDPADVALVEYDINCLSSQHLNDSWLHVQAALGEGCEEFPQLPNDTRKCLDIRQAYKNSVFDLSPHSQTFEPALIPELHSNYEEIPTRIVVKEVKKEQGIPVNEIWEKMPAIESNISKSDGEALRCNSLIPINSRLCHMYAYPQVLPEHDLVFKNPHCQLCLASRTAQETFGEILDSFMSTNKIYQCQWNTIELNVTFISKIFGHVVASWKPESLGALYEFHAAVIYNEKWVTVEVKQCPANQVYVPFYQKCCTITCIRGTHMVGKKCVNHEGYLDTSHSHKNYTGSLETVDVLFPNTLNTVTIKLRLWCTLDESDAKDDITLYKEGTEKFYAQSKDKIWHQDKKSSYKVFVSLISHIQNLVNHTVEISEPEICSRYSSNFNSVGDYCIFLTLTCNGDLTHDNLISLLTNSTTVFGLVNAAHNKNFILRDMALSNDLTDSELTATQAINQSGLDETGNELHVICRDGTVLHSELKTVIFNETGQSYNVKISDRFYALGSFLYSVKIDIDARSRAPRLSEANVSWCMEDFFIFECNYTTVSFNSSYFIRYGMSIVMTNHKKQMNEFREHVWGREGEAVNVRDFINLFQDKYGINDMVIYESNEFRVENDQVFVCSDFNSSFEIVQQSIGSQLHSHKSNKKLEQFTTFVALCVSITCLVVVLSIYSLIPELRNIPGRIVMSMSSALLLAQVLFLCSSLPRGLTCEIYASVHHAAWLTSSAWLTAMSVHLTFTLYSNSPAAHLSSSNSFTTISVLTWGLPLLISGCCFTLNKTRVVKMDYGKNGFCWIGNVHAMLFAFGVPMFTLLAVTCVCAVCVIGAITNSCYFRKRNTSTHTGVRKHLLLCINLGLLMGFNWVFYFVAVAVDASWMLVVFIFVNGSQGLYIFLCYVARKSVLTKLRKRLNLCKSSSENRCRNVESPQKRG